VAVRTPPGNAPTIPIDPSLALSRPNVPPSE
jgi:hypothetical protein